MSVELDVTKQISHVSNWVLVNQNLIIHYVVNIIAAIIILVVGVIISRIFAHTAKKIMQARDVDITITNFLSSLLRYIILIFTIIAALGSIGVQTTSIIAALGAAGLAVALALQGSLSNFAAGVLLVTFRPFRSGEFIELGSYSGTVDSIQIFSTSLKTSDNKTVIIPNNKIISSEIVNYTRQPNRRIEIIVGVSYEADIDEVKSVLTAVINKDNRIIKNLPILVRLKEMAPSSLDFIVRVWVPNEKYWDTYYDLMENFKKTLDEYKIGIPYPQMDVYLHKTP